MFKFMKTKKGFSLVELMIVVVIMAILVAVAVPIFNSVTGNARAKTNAYIAGGVKIVNEDVFHRGLCLPSDNKMTKEEQDIIIEIIRGCFK